MQAASINFKSGFDGNKLVRNARAAELAQAINIAHKSAGVVPNPPVNGNKLRLLNPGCFGKTGELTTTGFDAFNKMNSTKNLGVGATVNSTLKEYVAGMEKTIKQCLEIDNGNLYRKFEYLI